jgi:hypothetical protein
MGNAHIRKPICIEKAGFLPKHDSKEKYSLYYKLVVSAFSHTS